MDKEKQIKILRQRNAQLQEENDALKNKVKSIDKKFQELDELKNKWEQEILELNKLRNHYNTLVDDYKEMIELKKHIDR